MWLVYSILTTLSWGFADLFYKKGNAPNDKSSHIKTVVMVGVVMGIHAFAYMIIKDVPFSLRYLIIYLPVSFMYILSMAIGYFGLRYIELSISSPVQNSSGAVTAILIYIFFTHRLSFIEVSAIILITVGIVALSFFERRSDADAIPHREEDKKYRIGFLAIIFPILYCIIDGLGTFADAVYLDELSLIGEDQALLAYEFTFFIVAVIAIIYLFAKGERISFKGEKDRGLAAVFETSGQFFYVYAMAQNAIIVAPLVASYSAVAVVLSRIFLKEKLTTAQYTMIIIVMLGIGMLAVSEVL
jgi:drug/metabolite transporter (DMT)-like permease